MIRMRAHAFLLAGALLPVTQVAAAEITWHTIDGGGVMWSSGGTLRLSGTIGQPDATGKSGMAGGSFELTGGFWAVTLPSCTSFVVADFDHDCDVDGQDYILFSGCATGAEVPYDAANLPAACTFVPDGNDHVAADFDADGDVDMDDFGVFQRCYSGAGQMADPNCAN